MMSSFEGITPRVPFEQVVRIAASQMLMDVSRRGITGTNTIRFNHSTSASSRIGISQTTQGQHDQRRPK